MEYIPFASAYEAPLMGMMNVSHKDGKDSRVKIFLQVRRESYFWALRSFQMFILFQIKLHFLNTVSLSGFQSSLEAFKSTE